MKKLITTILSFLLLFSLTSCGNNTVSYTDKNGEKVEVKLEETNDQEVCKKALGYIFASDYVTSNMEAKLNCVLQAKDTNPTNPKDSFTTKATVTGSLKKEAKYLKANGALNLYTNEYDEILDKVTTDNQRMSADIDLDIEERMAYFAINIPGFSYKVKESLDSTTTPDQNSPINPYEDPMKLLEFYKGVLEIVEVNGKEFKIKISLNPKTVLGNNATGPIKDFPDVEFVVTAETKTGRLTSITSTYKASATYTDEFTSVERLAEIELSLDFKIKYPKNTTVEKLTDIQKETYLDPSKPLFNL